MDGRGKEEKWEIIPGKFSIFIYVCEQQEYIMYIDLVLPLGINLSHVK